MSAERCPGCGAREAELHWGECPWLIAYATPRTIVECGPKGLASGLFADHYWREYWTPKVGDFVVHCRFLGVVRVACLDAFLLNKENYRPVWPDEIAAFTGAGTQTSEVAASNGDGTFRVVFNQAAKVQDNPPASADPAMAAFIEDRRAAMRKALNAPIPFMVGVKPETYKIYVKCPCCNGEHSVREINGARRCPECNGSGRQEVRV